MHNTINLHDEHALVYTHVVHAGPRDTPLASECLHAFTLVCEGGSGYELPAAEAYAKRIAEEAHAWLNHARDRSRMRDDTLIRKALASVAFTLRHRAHDLAVPTKLSGVSRHQPTLWSLVRSGFGLGTALDVEEVQDADRVRLIISHEGQRLGEIQRKHVPWLRPLLPFGARVYLVRVTGQERDYTLGCNVAIGRVGGAVTALQHALGTDVGGDGYGGEEAAQGLTEASQTAVPAPPAPTPDHGGDGAQEGGTGSGLRLVSSCLSVAKPQADTVASPDDVVLYRDIDGTAQATVKHVVRHSPTGIEWGYHGSGPADLARSILFAFTSEAAAERRYVRYKAEVIAAVPYAGGVIRAAEVRAWLAANDDER